MWVGVCRGYAGFCFSLRIDMLYKGKLFAVASPHAKGKKEKPISVT